MLTEKQTQALNYASAVLRNQSAKSPLTLGRGTVSELVRLGQKAQAAENAANYLEKQLRRCGDDLESMSWKFNVTRIALACVSVLLLVVLVM